MAASGDLTLDPVLLDQARSELEQQYDAEHGGFGKAPKFPHPTSIERCLRHWAGAVNNGGNDLSALTIARQHFDVKLPRRSLVRFFRLPLHFEELEIDLQRSHVPVLQPFFPFHILTLVWKAVLVSA